MFNDITLYCCCDYTANERGRGRLLRAGMIDSLLKAHSTVGPYSLAAVLCLHGLVAFAFPSARGPAEVCAVLLFIDSGLLFWSVFF